MSYEEHDASKVDAALKGPAVVQVYYAKPDWIKDGVVKGWRVIIEHGGQLQWVLTYHKQLTEIKLHPEVEFARNSRFERTIKPWKRS